MAAGHADPNLAVDLRGHFANRILEPADQELVDLAAALVAVSTT